MKFIAFREGEAHKPFIFSTHKELAEYFGVATRTVSNWLRQGFRRNWVLFSMKNSDFKNRQKGGTVPQNYENSENDSEDSESLETPESSEIDEPSDTESESEDSESPLSPEEEELFLWLLSETINSLSLYDTPEFIKNNFFTAEGARNWIKAYKERLKSYIYQWPEEKLLSSQPGVFHKPNKFLDSFALHSLKKKALSQESFNRSDSPEIKYYRVWFTRIDDRLNRDRVHLF